MNESDTEGPSAQKILVAHVIHRLQVGGLENGLVNLINNMPTSRYRHAIICMTEYTDFRKRLNSDDVHCYALHKRAGKDLGVYYRLWKLLRKLKPIIIHTRNIGTIDCSFIALIAGVKNRVHGEHGRDMVDIQGNNKRYIQLRKICSLCISRFVALSKDLENWLVNDVKIPAKKIVQVYNGVDLKKFSRNVRSGPNGYFDEFKPASGILYGTVGRLSQEKDQLTLLKAFSRTLKQAPDLQNRLRLVIVGDGPLRRSLSDYIEQHDLSEQVLLTGARDDVPVLLQQMDVFVLPSLGEGISNTILEAMASAKPVIATRVGGNPELVDDKNTGLLVPPAAVSAMADAMRAYCENNDLIQKHGAEGRKRVVLQFSMENMVNRYLQIYNELLGLN